MGRAIYSAAAAAVVALTAATAKSVIGVAATANFGVDLLGFELGFDGATSTAIPPQIEICQATFATNGPGTNSTSITPVQESGRAITAGFTAAANWTTEPTVLTVMRATSLPAYQGSIWVDLAKDNTTPDNAVSAGFVIRITAPAAVNVRPTLYWARL